MAKTTCPFFLPGKDLCSVKFDKYGKEDMAKVLRIGNCCAYATNYSFDTCPDYKEKTEKK